MRFRYAKQDYKESMDTSVEINSLNELLSLIKGYQRTGKSYALSSERYDDPRDDWDSHWLLVNNYVAGTTDGDIANLNDKKD